VPDEIRRTLRTAAHCGDATVMIDLLDEIDVHPYLQLTGTTLVAETADRVSGADVLTGRCLTALEARRWDGDLDLHADLGAALTGAPTELQSLPTSLDDLAQLLDDAHREVGAISLDDGSVWPVPAIEYAEEFGEPIDLDDTDRWLIVHSTGSEPAYQDMVTFIDLLDDRTAAEKLSSAIEGRGAFRRFRRVLDAHDEIHTRWGGYSEERRLGRARAWLARAGYRPVVEKLRTVS
jgi:hypothetical protein